MGLGKVAGLVKVAVQVNIVQKLVRLGKTLGEKQSAIRSNHGCLTPAACVQGYQP